MIIKTMKKLMEEHLKRTIGVVGLAAAVVNITIGPAIFVLPALVVEKKQITKSPII